MSDNKLQGVSKELLDYIVRNYSTELVRRMYPSRIDYEEVYKNSCLLDVYKENILTSSDEFFGISRYLEMKPK